MQFEFILKVQSELAISNRDFPNHVDLPTTRPRIRIGISDWRRPRFSLRRIPKYHGLNRPMAIRKLTVDGLVLHAPSAQAHTRFVLEGPSKYSSCKRTSSPEAQMSNPKTLPACPKPKIYDGWIRKSDLDAWLDRYLPIPTQVISNEEYQPIPQTACQCRLEQEIVTNAAVKANYLGVDRRKFLRSSCGMALAFAAMNTIFGPFFRVEAAELLEPAAAAGSRGHGAQPRGRPPDPDRHLPRGTRAARPDRPSVRSGPSAPLSRR